MPPVTKIQSEDIINAAFEMVKEKGFGNLNARAIANRLNCSIQPIFYNFKTMDELKKVIFDKIYQIYKEYMLGDINDPHAYKKKGLSYIKFAKDYPEFFKILFMQKTTYNKDNFMTIGEVDEDTIKAGMRLSGFTYEEQKEFHLKVWIFTHGIATLVVNQTICFTDEEINMLLSSAVQEMMIGHIHLKGEK